MKAMSYLLKLEYTLTYSTIKANETCHSPGVFKGLKDKVKTTVKDKSEIKPKVVLRESGVEAVKNIICTSQDFNIFNCALF